MRGLAISLLLLTAACSSTTDASPPPTTALSLVPFWCEGPVVVGDSTLEAEVLQARRDGQVVLDAHWSAAATTGRVEVRPNTSPGAPGLWGVIYRYPTGQRGTLTVCADGTCRVVPRCPAFSVGALLGFNVQR